MGRAVEIRCDEQLHKVFSFVVRFYYHDCSARPGKKQLKILQPTLWEVYNQTADESKDLRRLLKSLFQRADNAVKKSVK